MIVHISTPSMKVLRQAMRFQDAADKMRNLIKRNEMKNAIMRLETSCNRPETIGADGSGGYWDNVYGDGVTLDENAVIMLANAVTGIRVNCITASSHINVCFVG